MTAYIIADVDVTNPKQYEEYKKLSSKAIETHGVKVLARGGVTELLEGKKPGRTVLLQFEDLTAAKRFYDSQEYQRAKSAREGAAVMNMFIVDGV
jgi:uncharacterized protein (DUF1330 family)